MREFHKWWCSKWVQWIFIYRLPRCLFKVPLHITSNQHDFYHCFIFYHWCQASLLSITINVNFQGIALGFFGLPSQGTFFIKHVFYKAKALGACLLLSANLYVTLHYVISPWGLIFIIALDSFSCLLPFFGPTWSHMPIISSYKEDIVHMMWSSHIPATPWSCAHPVGLTC